MKTSLPRRLWENLEPVDRLILGYLVLSTGWILFRNHPVEHLGRFFLTRAALLGLLAWFASGRFPESLRFVRDLYAPALTPVFYGEASQLNRAYTSVFHDARVIGWEQWMFGFQPAIELRSRFPNRWLSEYLHLAYFSYYIVGNVVLFYLMATRKREQLREYLATIGVTFFAGIGLFACYPVAGPFYVYTAPDPGSMGRVFPAVVHWVLHHGSSVGTAFPSSHVSVATTALLRSWSYSRKLFAALLLLVPGLAVGAVYGGFHYAVDALAGALLAVIVCAVVPWWMGRKAPAQGGA